MGIARVDEAINIRSSLDCYLDASSQSINEGKSFIYFFNTPNPIQQRIAGILRFQVGSLLFVYFSIPLAICSLPRVLWQDVIEKFQKKVSHWMYRWLSTMERVTLLKFVVQALPLYRFFVLSALASFLKDFEALCW